MEHDPHDPAPVPRTRRRARPTRRGAGLVLAAAAIALGAAACTATQSVEAGGGAGEPGRADATAPATSPPSSAAPGQSSPAATGSSVVAPSGPTTTCVEGPATTTPNDPGGGRITCSTLPPDAAVSSPPMTDTTYPPPTTTPLRPDNRHGVLAVSAVGGYDCPEGTACPAIGIVMAGTVVVTGPNDAEVTSELDPMMGTTGFLLTPGEYDVRLDATNGSCAPQSVTVGLARVDVALSCSVPMP